MLEQSVKCTNFGNCSKADNKEVILISEGADLLCPECSNVVTLISRPSGRGPTFLLPLGIVAVVLILLGICVPILSQAATKSHANIVSHAQWKFYTENGAAGSMDNITMPLNGSSVPGLHIKTDQVAAGPWNIGVSNPLKFGFKGDEHLSLTFWARAESERKITVVLQKNTPGFPFSFREGINIGTEWKEYKMPVNTIPMAPYESMFAIHCGHQQGWVEVAGIELRP